MRRRRRVLEVLQVVVVMVVVVVRVEGRGRRLSEARFGIAVSTQELNFQIVTTGNRVSECAHKVQNCIQY